MNRKVVIYTILDPRDNKIRYVGKSVDFDYRKLRHLYNAKKSTRSHKDAWIRGILKSGLNPIFEVLDECSEQNWKEVESYWIYQLIAWGFSLLNETFGGEGVVLVGKNKRIKPIYQYDRKGKLVREFDGYLSIKEMYPNFKRQGVQECCLGQLPTYKDFVWSYEQRQ